MERRQDIALGAVFMALGIAAAWMATSYSGAGGTYPMVLGTILTALGGTVAAKALRRDVDSERPLFDAPAKMVIAVAAGVIYVALVVPLGFYTSSFVLMVLLPLALGFRRAVYALVVAAVFISVVYVVFTVLLEKPLPREAFLSLFGSGG